ncbi:MAG: hypothetical protein CV089_20250 [Nitrospira sp. WS110]|nr:hypothetical protein [Nitrospira sp. WS110]
MRSVRHPLREEGERLCSKCGEHPRAHKQRWCPICRAEWKRAHRDQATRKAPLGNTFDVPNGVGNRSPSHRISPTGIGPLAAILDTVEAPLSQPHGGPVVPPEEADHALTELNQAWQAYEEARVRDWRTSRHTPGTILGPLAQRLQETQARCRKLGLTVPLERCSP